MADAPDDDSCRLAPGYPSPIVKHDEAREAPLAMFRRARAEATD